MRTARRSVNDRVKKLTIFSYGQPKVRTLISMGYRAHTIKTSNLLQREPQRADLNTRRELIGRLPRPAFITWARAGSLVGNQPL